MLIFKLTVSVTWLVVFEVRVFMVSLRVRQRFVVE